ncbi:MAG: histidinol phosphate phosphatase [Alphaproteobacteria bacterium]|nr:histidinol phosphate phosphatase [Alphaproteobacteria bacterium]
MSRLTEVPGGLVAFAQSLADVSGPVARRYFRTGVDVVTKGDESPVTLADRTAEEEIRKVIEATYPDHGIIGEEHGIVRQDAEWVWCLDPIDGTKAFIAGKPTFTTLIALFHEGTPVLGVIDQPIQNERWIGGVGVPATLNGQPIQVAKDLPIHDAVLNITDESMLHRPGYMDRFRRVMDAVRFTSWGGDAYGAALVASGSIHIMVEEGHQLYDWAALRPVIEAAGGVFTDWRGNRHDAVPGLHDVVATASPRLHEQVLRLLDA